MEKKLSAVIVTYFPDKGVLKELVDSLSRQEVGLIVVVDNTARDAYFETMISSEQTVYLSLGENKGVAFAQNEGIKLCLARAATHVFIFDQDSDLPADYIEAMLETEACLCRDGIKVAAIGPAFKDKKSARLSKATSFRWWGLENRSTGNDKYPLEVDHIISSGSLIRSVVFRDIGGMIDSFFIDWVDIEWCLRAVCRGYKVFLVPDVVMMHSIGYSTRIFFNRVFVLHNVFRTYFMLRNALLMARLPTLSLEKKTGIVVFALKDAMKNFVLMPDRFALLNSYRRAIVGAFATPTADLPPRVFWDQ